MVNTWTTRDGEMADEIAWRVYGDRADGLTALLEANPQLAQLPPMLPAGLILSLPDLPEITADDDTLIRLFS